jgi:hypothetical protein
MRVTRFPEVDDSSYALVRQHLLQLIRCLKPLGNWEGTGVGIGCLHIAHSSLGRDELWYLGDALGASCRQLRISVVPEDGQKAIEGMLHRLFPHVGSNYVLDWEEPGAAAAQWLR